MIKLGYSTGTAWHKLAGDDTNINRDLVNSVKTAIRESGVIRAQGGPVDAFVSALAKKYYVSEGEVLLRWSIDRGDVSVTTCAKELRLKQYLRVVKFELTPWSFKYWHI